MADFNLQTAEEQKKEWKRSKLDAIREYHKGLINDLGISITDFNMKMPFYDKSGKLVVGIFASEFKKDKGFFFELVTRELDPVDDKRIVYRIPFNTAFEEEYELNEKGSYLVSIEELRVVDSQSIAISKYGPIQIEKQIEIEKKTENRTFTTNTSAPDMSKMPMYKAPAPMDDSDAPYSQMTIRDYYAIHTGKPVSGKTWLNDLIKQK
jgi:hypothetical protein